MREQWMISGDKAQKMLDGTGGIFGTPVQAVKQI